MSDIFFRSGPVTAQGICGRYLLFYVSMDDTIIQSAVGPLGHGARVEMEILMVDIDEEIIRKSFVFFVIHPVNVGVK